ncbi:MAG: glycoside hydrolase family 3 C-terminal domain-containing protein [Acidimicrobiales bacterium]
MSRDLPAMVARLDLDEKTTLLAGADLFSMAPLEQHGIPSVRVTDGSNGARGPELRGAVDGEEPLTSTCVPCGAALGATWDTALVERIGALVGRQARIKACRVLLAPTVNLHRNPLGGRNFESYSEDPLLAGRMGAAYIRGAQSAGVACTVKHFAGNEYEKDRMLADSIIDSRALRELHLVPFELAVQEGGALGVMTAYNRLNGRHCPDNPWLLQELLRDEWGFDGFVVTDWYGFVDTAEAISAGLDLEMPGPGRSYGPRLAEAVRSGRVDEALVDAAALRLLSVMDRVGALDDPPHEQPGSEDRPEDRLLARQCAVAATVLLKNSGVLPLDQAGLRRMAVIGPNAGRAVIMGGGSSSVHAHYLRSPLDALRDRLGPGVAIDHEPAVDFARACPEVPNAWLRADGTPGMAVEFYREGDLGGELVHATTNDTGAVVWFGATPRQVGRAFSWRARAELTVEVAGRWTISLVQTDPARLLVDGVVVLDGFADPPGPGHDFFGLAKQEMTVALDLSPEKPVRIEVQSDVRGPAIVTGAKIGIRPAPAADGIERAVSAAERADAVILVVGTDENWETEGADRESMALPGAQDELVRRVLEVAPHAIVVLNVGAPVTTPWAAEAGAVVQCWFGGQEMADGLVDVLLGDADPGGRLPTTMPVRLEDTPSWGNAVPEGGRVRYGEGVLVGYRWYESRGIEVSFPFGHGLSFSSFEIGVPELSASTIEPGGTMSVRVPVTNTGDRPGTEVVQVYVAPGSPGAFRPRKELKGFAKASLAPGESTVLEIELGDRAFARWAAPDPALRVLADQLARDAFWTRQPERVDESGWIMDPGPYDLHVGRSSVDIVHVVPVEVPVGGPLAGRSDRRHPPTGERAAR